MKAYIWKEKILTNYRSGMAIAVTDDIEQARGMILKRYWDEDVVPNTYEGEEVEWDEWPWYKYKELEEALNQEPEIQELPIAIYVQGSD